MLEGRKRTDNLYNEWETCENQNDWGEDIGSVEQTKKGITLVKVINCMSYVTIWGWFCAFVLASISGHKKDASFHLNQSLSIIIINIFLISIQTLFFQIKVIDTIINVEFAALSIYGLISAARGMEKKIPIVSELALLIKKCSGIFLGLLLSFYAVVIGLASLSKNNYDDDYYEYDDYDDF